MGISAWFDRLLGRKKAIQSIQSAIQSDSIDSIADKIPKEEPVLVTSRGFTETSRSPSPEPTHAVVEKDSYHLGLAAGYTGRSIKEIEHSMLRIESRMVTKDWFKNEFVDQTPILVDLIEKIRNDVKEHDLSVQNRFESIQSALNRLQGTAVQAPEPIKTDILKEIETIRSQIPLSSRMKDIVLVVKSVREISYTDLAIRLGITVPALRGLISNTMKRTDEIERFKRNGKGWIRYKGD